MPIISFHHGAKDKLLSACRLTLERYREGRKILVYAPEREVAEGFDARLWDFASTVFVPHCRAGSPLAGETPVVISAAGRMAGFDDVLLNLARELPPDAESFREIIEVVASAEDDAVPARARFRQYKQAGYSIEAHPAPT